MVVAPIFTSFNNHYPLAFGYMRQKTNSNIKIVKTFFGLALIVVALLLGAMAVLYLTGKDYVLGLLPGISQTSEPSDVVPLESARQLIFEVREMAGPGSYRVADLANFSQEIIVHVPSQARFDAESSAIVNGSFLVVSEYVPIADGIVATQLGVYSSFPAKYAAEPVAIKRANAGELVMPSGSDIAPELIQQ